MDQTPRPPLRERMYYEAHITIEPVEGERRERLGLWARENGMTLADFHLAKPGQPAPSDFVTARGTKDEAAIGEKIRGAVVSLQSLGYRVTRYKIEETLLDSRRGDVFGLLQQPDRTPTQEATHEDLAHRGSGGAAERSDRNAQA